MHYFLINTAKNRYYFISEKSKKCRCLHICLKISQSSLQTCFSRSLQDSNLRGKIPIKINLLSMSCVLDIVYLWNQYIVLNIYYFSAVDN